MCACLVKHLMKNRDCRKRYRMFRDLLTQSQDQSVLPVRGEILRTKRAEKNGKINKILLWNAKPRLRPVTILGSLRYVSSKINKLNVQDFTVDSRNRTTLADTTVIITVIAVWPLPRTLSTSKSPFSVKQHEDKTVTIIYLDKVHVASSRTVGVGRGNVKIVKPWNLRTKVARFAVTEL